MAQEAKAKKMADAERAAKTLSDVEAMINALEQATTLTLSLSLMVILTPTPYLCRMRIWSRR